MKRILASKVLLLMAIGVICSAVSGCKPEDIVSTSDEVEVGRQASIDVEKKYPISKDVRQNQLVSGIGENILRHITVRKGITYTFKVIDSDEVNAFALPGGWIYVERGLIEAAKGDTNQIAGVIAHEIGHVQARHSAEQMGRQQIYGIAIGTLTKGNVQQYAAVFANLNLLHYSREEEYEADKLGIDYTCPSQYNPQGLINFFRVLVASEKRGATPAFLQTHPLTENRILRAEDYLAKKKAAGQCK